MIYGKVYLTFGGGLHANSVFHPFLFTTTKSEEFARLLNALDKPVHGFVIPRSSLVRSAVLRDLGKVHSKGAVIALNAKHTRIDDPDLALSLHEENRYVLPSGTHIKTTHSLIFSRECPTGSESPLYDQNMMAILRKDAFAVRKEHTASPADIARALWKCRNHIHIIPVRHKHHDMSDEDYTAYKTALAG